jgi:hypothetical protein
MAGVTIAGACGSDDGGDAASFCSELAAHSAEIVSPTLVSDGDVDDTVDLYRRLGERAPLAIVEEWRDLVENVETASTVAPDDPESVQRAVAVAYATERSAVAVHRWVLDNCGLDLGPVATIAPQGPAPTTTLPPDVSTSLVDVATTPATTPVTAATSEPAGTPQPTPPTPPTTAGG